MDVVGCCIDKPLFSSVLMLNFMYEIMILMFEHTYNRQIRGGGAGRAGGGGTITKISCLL